MATDEPKVPTDESNGSTSGSSKSRWRTWLSGTLAVTALGLVGLNFVPQGTPLDDIKEDLGGVNQQLLEMVPEGIRHAGKEEAPDQTVPLEDGDGNAGNLYQEDGGMFTLATASGDVLFAPTPPHQFRDVTCDLTPKSEARPAHQSWTVPSITQFGTSSPLSASWNYSGWNNTPVIVPDAPLGTAYASDAHLSDETGAVLQLGHVNYTSNPYAISPWGQLYQLGECAHIYQTDENGQTSEYVVTSLYTVSNYEFSTIDEYFRKDGPKTLYMVTCSGPYVGNAGFNTASGVNQINLGYAYNLVVEAVPVSA